MIIRIVINEKNSWWLRILKIIPHFTTPPIIVTFNNLPTSRLHHRRIQLYNFETIPENAQSNSIFTRNDLINRIQPSSRTAHSHLEHRPQLPGWLIATEKCGVRHPRAYKRDHYPAPFCFPWESARQLLHTTVPSITEPRESRRDTPRILFYLISDSFDSIFHSGRSSFFGRDYSASAANARQRFSIGKASFSRSTSIFRANEAKMIDRFARMNFRGFELHNVRLKICWKK